MLTTSLVRRAVAASPAVLLSIAICGLSSCDGGPSSGVRVTQFTTPASSVQDFAARLDQLRNDLKMPGMAAVIAIDQRVAWSSGFGLADVENRRNATPTTTYHLASLTKTFCATVLLQLAEEGRVTLEDPVSQYGVPLTSSGTIRVKHLLSHTSQGTPGAQYIYNGDRFAHLSAVVAGASGRSFGELASERILRMLGLLNTAPNVDSIDFAYAQLDRQVFSANIAQPYEITASGNVVAGSYPTGFNCAAGMMGSAVDVAQYSMAMDRDGLLLPATKNLAWTNFILNSGARAPYGLGWFVQDIGGTKVVWHYGLWTANSSLIIKVPERGLTFVLLANTDRLSRDWDLSSGDVMVSPFAREFVNAFVTGSTPIP